MSYLITLTNTIDPKNITIKPETNQATKSPKGKLNKRYEGRVKKTKDKAMVISANKNTLLQ